MTITAPLWTFLAVGITSLLGVVFIVLTLVDIVVGRVTRRAAEAMHPERHGEEACNRSRP